MDDKELYEKMYPTTPDKVALLVTSALTISTLVSAIRSARKGEYDKAIFKAVIWTGLTHNSNVSHTMKYRKVRDAAR